MACPNGYIEVNGDCVYAFGNASGVGPDGTPLPQNQGGGFWGWVNTNLPDILIAAGSVWQSSQQPNPPSANPLPPAAQQNKMPVWVWILLALAVLVILFLLLRGRSEN
jgi:hypothetical protein